MCVGLDWIGLEIFILRELCQDDEVRRFTGGGSAEPVHAVRELGDVDADVGVRRAHGGVPETEVPVEVLRGLFLLGARRGGRDRERFGREDAAGRDERGFQEPECALQSKLGTSSCSQP